MPYTPTIVGNLRRHRKPVASASRLHTKPEWILFLIQACTWTSLRQTNWRDYSESETQPDDVDRLRSARLRAKISTDTKILCLMRAIALTRDSSSPTPSCLSWTSKQYHKTLMHCEGVFQLRGDETRESFFGTSRGLT